MASAALVYAGSEARLADDTWIALDFETATPDRASVCALGVAVVQDGAVVRTDSWLIRPPANRYSERTIAIHGITPLDTANAPSFGEIYQDLLPYLQDRHLIAHSASFDISVLRACLAAYRMPAPELRYICSCTMARRAFPALPNHRLPTVCGHCGISLRHHDAVSDALACANIALACKVATDSDTIHAAVRALGVPVHHI